MGGELGNLLFSQHTGWLLARTWSEQMVEGRCIASQGDQRQPTIAAACTGCRRLRAGSQEPCLCFPNLVMPGPATRRLDRRWGDPVEHCRATISLIETITKV